MIPQNIVALCGPCGHYAEKKWIERGCKCRCHQGAAVFPRTWVTPDGYKFATTDREKRARKAEGISGRKASKKFRKALNDAA